MMKRFLLAGPVALFSILLFSCESLQAALASMGQSISEATSNISSGSGSSLTGAKYDPNKRGDPDAASGLRWPLIERTGKKGAGSVAPCAGGGCISGIIYFGYKRTTPVVKSSFPLTMCIKMAVNTTT